MKYQYDVVEFDDDVTGAAIASTLSELGADGWRIVSSFIVECNTAFLIEKAY